MADDPRTYAAVAPALCLTQNLAVIVVCRVVGWPLVLDADFWLFPLRRFAAMPDLSASTAALAFALSLLVAAALATLSFRRARWSGGGYAIAAMTIVPGAQLFAIVMLALLPRLARGDAPEPARGSDVLHIVQGVLSGMGIIVLSVLVSAIGFGAYGWGLFVMTPLLVGVTTAYIANRRNLLSARRSAAIVLSAAALGTIALVSFALEGLVCIIMAAPLGAMVALIGGKIGRAIARTGQSRNPPLMSLAVLPVLFALEGAMPPNLVINSTSSVDIAAPPTAVWQAVVSNEPIRSGPGLIGATGLAYPIGGRLQGVGVGAVRLGDFSTGTARETVTEWAPLHALSFAVLHQPPAMAEMSPYAQVHAPHVSGYFNTATTRFSLYPLRNGGTRLTVNSTHILRIDPVLYWEPIARMAIDLNVTRVLRDIRFKAERNRDQRSRMRR